MGIGFYLQIWPKTRKKKISHGAETRLRQSFVRQVQEMLNRFENDAGFQTYDSDVSPQRPALDAYGPKVPAREILLYQVT